MDFFARQEAARRKTVLLLCYFILAAAGIIFAIYSLLVSVWLYNNAIDSFWYPELLLHTSWAVLLIIALGSFYKIIMLQGGGGKVAEMLGGTLLQQESNSVQERMLLNVVEEMSIASGIPVPPVYVLRQEDGINAFAAGFSPETAVIGVTSGALQKLSRDELQGVIGHEFSHILNGDMRLNLKLMGFLHGILVIAVIGRVVLRGMSRGSRGRSRNNKGGGALALFALGLIAIGYIGVLFGNIIKAAVSRQREHLADASAVQFTRNPPGLAGALKKIASMAQGSHLESSRAEEASHMYFANGLGKAFLNLLSTHPPLSERIKLLDPQFTGEITDQAAVDTGEAAVSSFAGSGRAEGTVTVNDVTTTPDRVLATVGTIFQSHLRETSRLLGKLPQRVREAARNPFSARAIIYGLLIDKDNAVRKLQLEGLRENADDLVCRETEELLPLLQEIETRARLPLVDLAAAALRGLSPSQYKVFRDNVDMLVRADRKVKVFEYALRHILFKNLDAAVNNNQPKSSGGGGFPANEISIILSLQAGVGHRDEAMAGKAFADSITIFDSRQQKDLALLSPDRTSLDDLDTALDRLAVSSPAVKKKLMKACLLCLGFDRKVTDQEAELFRAIGEALSCPVPIML